MGNNQPKPDALAFSERLHEALDAIPGVPARVERGRGAWLAKQLGVAQPTAHAWLKGEYIPVPDRVKEIAKLASVNNDWLYFGIPPKRGEIAPPVAPSGGGSAGSHSVREDDFKLALRLTAEAIGRELYLAPEEQTALGLTILDLIVSGMPEAQILPIAQRMANGFAQGRKRDAGPSSTGRGN